MELSEYQMQGLVLLGIAALLLCFASYLFSDSGLVHIPSKPMKNIRDIMTAIGGILGFIAPIMITSHDESIKNWGGVIMSVSALLLGQRGVTRGPNDPVLPMDTVSTGYDPRPVPAIERVVIQRIQNAAEYPEQNLAPKIYESKEDREKAFQEWRKKSKP